MEFSREPDGLSFKASVVLRSSGRIELSFIRLCVLIRLAFRAGDMGGSEAVSGGAFCEATSQPPCGGYVIIETLALIPLPAWKLSFNALEAHNHG